MARPTAVTGERTPPGSDSILATALLVSLTRPSTWLTALATFLVRGGIVWFLVPIVTLPTPVGLANAIGPSIVDVVLRGLTLGLLFVIGAGVAVLLVWLVGGGLVAARLEAALIDEVAADDELAGDGELAGHAPGGSDRATGIDLPTRRVLAVRLIALVPLLAALALGAIRIVDATYLELTLPSDSTTPLVWRVLRSVPLAIAVVGLAWLVGEVIGGLAARRVVLDGRSIRGALTGAIGEVVRHPIRSSVRFGIPTAILFAVLVPSIGAADAAWNGLRDALAGPGPWPDAAISFLVFLALWSGGLVLTGAVCAWRHATWTVARLREPRGDVRVVPDRPTG